MVARERMMAGTPKRESFVSKEDIARERQLMKILGYKIFSPPSEVTVDKYPWLKNHLDPRSNGALLLRFTEDTFTEFISCMELSRRLVAAARR